MDSSPPTARSWRGRVALASRTVRRAVLLRRRLLAAVLTAAAVATGLQLSAPPAPDTVRVLAAASDLPAGAVLTGDDLVEVDLPPESLPSGVVPRDSAVGRHLASPLRRGEPITDVRLVAPSLLEGYPGLVAVPVRIPDAASVGLLRVGDVVDVVAADPSGAQAARPVASRVPVLALPSAAEGAAGPAAGGGAGAGGALGGGLVVLGLSPESGRQVAAEAVRSVLSIVLTH